MILEMPAFDSKYVSLMITATTITSTSQWQRVWAISKNRKKCCCIPHALKGTTANRLKVWTAIFECTGDFVSAVFRVMPHANEAARFKRLSSR